jgi:hypothetical protein
VVFEVQEVADDDPRQEAETMAVSGASWNDGEERPEVSDSSGVIRCDDSRGF